MPPIYIDMDNVFVDFVAGAYARYRRHVPLEPTWITGVEFGLAPADFEARCDRPFWAGLPWTEEGEAFVDGVERIFGLERIRIASSPMEHCLGAWEGKQDWLLKHRPSWAGKLNLTYDKGHLGGPGRFLADDRDSNCEAFRRAGGFACLIPRSWNRNRIYARHNRFNVESTLAFIESWARTGNPNVMVAGPIAG